MITKDLNPQVDKLANPKYSLAIAKKGIVGDRKELRGLYANARSLANKMGELELLMYEEDFDFVGISETWFDSSHDWLATIQGYSLYRRDREGKKG